MNVFVIIETMGVVAHSQPNYTAAGGSAGAALGGTSVTPDANGTFPPIIHSAGLPASTTGFIGAVDGLMQAVYAYGGAMLFIEFMAEMRRPRDFWKGMICAQSFIVRLISVLTRFFSLCGCHRSQTALRARALFVLTIATLIYG
jgi:hypothetical protein